MIQNVMSVVNPGGESPLFISYEALELINMWDKLIMITEEERALCEAFEVCGCANGWTACPINSLRDALEKDMAPYRQGGLVKDDGKIDKDKFVTTLKRLLKKCHVTRRIINGVPHYCLDKESFYPG